MQTKILVVDDDPLQTGVLGEILKLYGYVVWLAQDGHEAQRIVIREPPNLVLLDVNLRDMSGLDVCRQLKQNPQTAAIPIVLISGLSDTQDRMRALEAGADEFLGKPFNISDLLKHIRSLLKADETQNSQTDAA